MDHSKTSYAAIASDLPAVEGKKLIVAFFLGMSIVAASIILGKSYAFFISFLVFSVFVTLLWRKTALPWIFLVSISAATPIAISRQQFTCNLIFALWFVIFNIRYLFRLPKWIYIPAALATIGIFTSAINWVSGDVIRSFMRQGAYAYNLFLAPFLLLPVVYQQMSKSRDHEVNLSGLLFCLIIPSTVILIAAKLFGTVSNEWEASLHVQSLPEGFLQYQLGRIYVSFLRTDVGFILAALICASAAVTISQVKVIYRVLAGMCLASNVFLLLATGSFGSGFSCCCGLICIFFIQLRKVSIIKAVTSLVVIVCVLILAYGLSPESTKTYLGKRYEHRVVKANTDRFVLWGRALDQISQHPEGVGLTLAAGEKVKSNVHNEYLVYTVSYGLIGGLGYTFLVVALLISFFRKRKNSIESPAALAVYLAGLGVIVAVAINFITDHLNANRWYFNVIWSLIWYSYFCSRSTQVLSVRENTKQSVAIL